MTDPEMTCTYTLIGSSGEQEPCGEAAFATMSGDPRCFYHLMLASQQTGAPRPVRPLPAAHDK